MVNFSIFGVFVKSPITAIQHHMDLVLQGVCNLVPFFQASLDLNWQQAAQLQEKIIKLEQQADQVKKQLRSEFPRTMLLPLERTELIGILKTQDKLANLAKKIAILVQSRKMLFPAQLTPSLLSFIELNINAVTLTRNAINELDQLVESSFAGSEARLVENIILQIEHAERQSDERQYELQMSLFEIEKELNPIEAMLMSRIFDDVGALADHAQDVGHRLELLLSLK